VVAAVGVATRVDAVIIARVKIVAAIMTYLLFFLLRCFIISHPSTNTMDKRILLHGGLERQKKAINGFAFYCL
jgi:hypothetical protein